MAPQLRRIFCLLAGLTLFANSSPAGTTGTLKANPDPARGAKPCRIDGLARPYVLLSASRLEKLRTEIQPSGPKRDYYEAVIRANAERWVNRAVRIPARSGHYHNFVCVDGTRLRVPSDQDFGTTTTYQCPSCGAWYSGEKYDGARRNYEHHWMMLAARDLALAYALEGKREYAEKTSEILRKYAAAYPGRHTGNTTGGIYYQSLDESMFLIPLAQAYDLVHDSGTLSAEEKAHVERDLFWESAEGLVACGARTNWGSWHLSAVGIIGLATKHQRYIDYGVEKFQAQIREELGDDGLWPESVHTYHFFPLAGFVSLAEASTNAGMDLWNWEARPGKGLRTMFTAPLRYMYPDTRLPAINDGWFDSFLPGDLYAAAYSRYRDPEMLWAMLERSRQSGRSAGAAVEDRTWSFVVGEQLPNEAVRPELVSTNFPVLGISVLRTGGSSGAETMITFDYGRMLGHGQLDVMGITFFAGGKLLIADYGTPSYGAGILPYYKGTSSHNTVAVDGQNQKPTRNAELLAFKATPLVKLSSARTAEALPGVSWRRSVLLTESYGLVIDDLASTETHTYDCLLHSEGNDLRLTDGAASAGEVQLPYEHLTGTVAFRPSGTSFTAEWKAETGGGLIVTGASDRELELFTGRTPAETAVRTVPLLVQRRRGTSARFVSVLRHSDRSRTAPAVSLEITPQGEILLGVDGHSDSVQMTASRIRWRREGAPAGLELDVKMPQQAGHVSARR